MSLRPGPALRLKTAIALLLCSAAAAAHNFHMGMADISYNPNTGGTEVVHTYTAHDVEALLGNLYQRQFDLSDADDQAVLQRYLERRFYLTAGGKRLPLQLVGMQANADSLLIYQELPGAALPPDTALYNGMLTDFLPQQINTVNVGNGKEVSTLTFDAAHAEQRLR
jgi:hypothetical protein